MSVDLQRRRWIRGVSLGWTMGLIALVCVGGGLGGISSVGSIGGVAVLPGIPRSSGAVYDQPNADIATTFTVNEYAPARGVPASILGLNLQGDNAWNATVQKLIAGTTTTYLRYPSGVCGEGLNWTSGASYGDLCWNNQIVVTAAQFVTDCEAVHCHAIMQVPTEIDSPSTAAYYVAWLEQTENFTPAYFELGNEPTQWTHFGCPWSTWTSTCASGGNASPTTYPPVAAAYVKAIRSVDTTTPIIGLGGVGQTIHKPDGGVPNSGYDWAYQLYKKLGNSIQAISVHDYPGRYNTASSAAQFYSTLTTGDALLPNMQQAQSGLAAGCPNCTGQQILITESNIYSCGGCNGKYSNSFADDLAMGVDITEAIDYGAVNLDLESLYNGGLTGNWFGPQTPEPVYYLYSDIFARMPLSQGSADWLQANETSGPGMLWLAATYQAPNSWTLLVLNLNVSYAASLTVTGSGFPTAGQFTFYSWNGSTTQPVASTGSSFSSVSVGPQSLLLVVAASATNSSSSPPPAPTGLALSGATTSSLTFHWVQSNGTVILNDTVYLFAGSTCAGGSTPFGTLGAATTLTIPSLFSDTPYSAWVTAWNGSGESAPSGCASGRTANSTSSNGSPPPAPTGLTLASATSSTLAFRWTQSSGTGIQNDTVYLFSGSSCTGRPTPHGTLGPATTLTVRSLFSGTPYSTWVTAWNASGESPPSGCDSVRTLSVALGTYLLTGSLTTTAATALLSGAGVTAENGPTTTTDSLGAYELPLANGTYAITVTAAGMHAVSAFVTISGGPVVQDFVLIPFSWKVTGIVTEATTGRSIASANVSLASDALGYPAYSMTDASGRFALLLPNGTYQLRAMLPGWTSALVNLPVGGRDLVANLTMQPTASAGPGGIVDSASWNWAGLAAATAGVGLLAAAAAVHRIRTRNRS